MIKFLTFQNTLLASTFGVLLLGFVAASHAFADDHNGGKQMSREAFLEKAGTRFDRLDADSDGLVTQAEVDTKIAERLAKMQERVAQMFSRIDSDGDGLIQSDNRGYGRLSDRLDLDGPLTLEQVQAAMTAKFEQRQADRTLEMGETIPAFPQTRDEALRLAAERFDARDANGDGVLSSDELPKRDK